MYWVLVRPIIESTAHQFGTHILHKLYYQLERIRCDLVFYCKHSMASVMITSFRSRKTSRPSVSLTDIGC